MPPRCNLSLTPANTCGHIAKAAWVGGSIAICERATVRDMVR